jgi:ATP-binding cassette, subfamily B (MDR/TAP), member 1
VSVTPVSDAPTALSAPVSEFAIATLKNPGDRQKWEDCLKVTLDGMKITKGAICGVNGIAEGNPDQYVFVIGWESLEVRHIEPASGRQVLTRAI